MEVIFGASILASFLAGMVALFAPCCITVLLPSYLASVFRTRRQILKMTFVFFAGITTVLLPIGLGVAALANLFRDYHNQLDLFGGALMIWLAALTLTGTGFEMPFLAKVRKGASGGSHAKSVYALGVFSGAATACCAPVLAGAMTLAVISGTFLKALIVVFAYIFGMTLPLFLAAYCYDRFNLESLAFFKGKTLRFPIFGREWKINSIKLLSAAVFGVMGATLIYLGLTHNSFFSPELQVRIGEKLNEWSNALFLAMPKVPDYAWGALILALFGWFVYAMFKGRKIKKLEEHDDGKVS